MRKPLGTARADAQFETLLAGEPLSASCAPGKRTASNFPCLLVAKLFKRPGTAEIRETLSEFSFSGLCARALSRIWSYLFGTTHSK